MEAVLMFLLLIALGIASIRWGFDSTDKIESPEWVRRAAWDTDQSARLSVTEASSEPSSRQ